MNTRLVFDPSLYLVTDRRLIGNRRLEDIVSEAVAGGCSMVQLREKDTPTAEFVQQALMLKKRLAGTGVPLIINDRIDIALAIDADGVHLGQSDMPYDQARRLLGPRKMIGLSVENLSQVQQANALDVDYIAVSPVFATPTKTDTAQPLGLEGAAQVVALSRHPVVGIGGINRQTVVQAMATGLDGVAMVSDIMKAESPFAVAKILRGQIEASRTHIFNVPAHVCANKHYPRVLTIAGSDSGGGAGVQADIKTISACGCYAASAITAITVQNTLGVQAVSPVPVDTIQGQIQAVLDDIGTDAIKIGMLHSQTVVRMVAETLSHYDISNIVLDPVMVSTSGHRLIETDSIQSLVTELMPKSRIITPNIPEAEILLGQSLSAVSQLSDAARRLSDICHTSVLLKAGHLSDARLTDVLYDREQQQLFEFATTRIITRNTHGTGCTLSSAIASFLAKGHALPDAVQHAQDYIHAAIVSGADYQIGHGFGPVDHFYAMH